MKVSKSHLTERKGIVEVERRVNTNFQWLFREQPISDFGVDAHIEIVVDEEATGRLLAVQVKCGPNYFSKSNADGYIYRGKNAHLDYWVNHSLPVIIIIFNPETDECLWQQITEKTVERTKKGWKTIIHRSNTFDENSLSALNRAALGSPYTLRLRQLQIAKPWMIALQAGKRLFIEINQWINKSSGRGDFTLLRSHDEKEEPVAEWPYLISPRLNYEEFIPSLFPWAKITIDEEYYESYDENQYKNECAIYSSGECVAFTDSFTEWKEQNLTTRIRPFCDDNEVAQWRLELTLNKLGKSFLRLDNFLLNT